MVEFQGPCFVDSDKVIAVSSCRLYIEEWVQGSKIHLKGGGSFRIKGEADDVMYIIRQQQS